MAKENLALELFNKHAEALGMADSTYIQSETDLLSESSAPLQSAVAFLPKSKALIDMTMALVSGKVAEGGTVVLAGEKKAGIESAKKAYEANVGPVDQKIVGNHSALYVGKNKRLGAGKTLKDFLKFVPLAVKEQTIEAAVLPGVFSAGELDEGTALLLDVLPFDRKSVLDVGCGAGVIGTFYKKIFPASAVTMTDASILATKASAWTLEKNGLDAKIVLSDVFDSIEGKFDLIACNPPFHSGITTDYSFIERFARGARAHLNPGGEVWVVANSFLPYREMLEKHIGPTETAIENPKFRVFKSKAR